MKWKQTAQRKKRKKTTKTKSDIMEKRLLKQRRKEPVYIGSMQTMANKNKIIEFVAVECRRINGYISCQSYTRLSQFSFFLLLSLRCGFFSLYRIHWPIIGKLQINSAQFYSMLCLLWRKMAEKKIKYRKNWRFLHMVNE